MKSKGFTLIELLAVIVILAIIALIAVPIILNIIDSTKKSANERSVELYGKAVENAVGRYQVKHPEDIEITEQEILPYIEYKGNDVNCEITDINNDGTIYLERCKVNDKKVEYTYGKNQKICRLVEGESQKVGTKYTCALDINRTFYVLETSEKDVSLLMEQNFTDGDGTNGTIPPTVAWCTDGGSDNTTCKNISTTGREAPEGKDYMGHITKVFNKEGVVVSFPTKEQMVAVGCYNSFKSCPTWAYNYLKETPNSVDVLGYWTVSPLDSNSIIAIVVEYRGYTSISYVHHNEWCGLRPVITLSKSLLD